MKNNAKVIVLATVLALTGCGTTDTQGEEGTGYSRQIMETAWFEQSVEDRELMCWGWGYDQETMLDSFFDQIDPELGVTRKQAITFFDGKCG